MWKMKRLSLWNFMFFSGVTTFLMCKAGRNWLNWLKCTWVVWNAQGWSGHWIAECTKRSAVFAHVSGACHVVLVRVALWLLIVYTNMEATVHQSIWSVENKRGELAIWGEASAVTSCNKSGGKKPRLSARGQGWMLCKVAIWKGSDNRHYSDWLLCAPVYNVKRFCVELMKRSDIYGRDGVAGVLCKHTT